VVPTTGVAGSASAATVAVFAVLAESVIFRSFSLGLPVAGQHVSRDRFPAVQDPSRRLSRSSDPRTMATLAPSRRPLGAAHDANSREVIAPAPTPALIPSPNACCVQ